MSDQDEPRCEDQPPHVVIELLTAPDGCTEYAEVHTGGRGMNPRMAAELLRNAADYITRALAETN